MYTTQPEALSIVSEREPDHVYTSDQLPELIGSGSIRSWNVTLPHAEATVGEIDPNTTAIFPVDARGEKITFLDTEEAAHHLGLLILDNTVSRFVQLDDSNPSVQTVPGQRIVITGTGDSPTYYLCEYRNEACESALEVSPDFESIRSLVWNLAHHHPSKSRRAERSSHILEIDDKQEHDLHVKFSYSPGEPQPEITFYEDIADEIGQTATLLGGISINGALDIKGLTQRPVRDWHSLLLLADGRVLYTNTSQCIALNETELKSAKSWLLSHADKLWSQD
jgi:hypothetical protein